jgi:hypothetical protein
LPRPIAEPAAAAMTPNLLLKLSRSGDELNRFLVLIEAHSNLLYVLAQRLKSLTHMMQKKTPDSKRYPELFLKI